MIKDYTQAENKSTPIKLWDRNHVVKGVIDFEQVKDEQSLREYAKNTGIPRGTITIKETPTAQKDVVVDTHLFKWKIIDQ